MAQPSPVVVAGVPLVLELADDVLVVDWLAPIVKAALKNIELSLDKETLAKHAALAWCQLQTVKSLRARKADAFTAYEKRLTMLASRVMCAAVSCGSAEELTAERTMELEDLAAAIIQQVGEKLEAKAVKQPAPATAPGAAAIEDAADDAAARAARAKELKACGVRAPAKRKLALADRQNANELGADETTPIYAEWLVEVEEQAKKATGAPRGRTARPIGDGIADGKAAAAERRAAAAENPTFEQVAVYRCGLCNGPVLRTFEALFGHRNGPRSCTRRLTKAAAPVDDQVQQTPSPKRRKTDEDMPRVEGGITT